MTANALVTIALTAVLAGAAPLPGQSSAVDGRLLPTAVDTFTVSFRGTPIGRGIMERSRQYDTLLVQAYEWRGVDGEVVIDSLVSDARSLRSIREVRIVEGAVISVEFNDSVRTVLSVDGSVAGEISRQLGAGVFSSAALEAIVAASPLAEGYEAEVALYYAPPAQLGVTTSRIRVLGAESVVHPPDATREAWVVEATTPDGATTFWIDRQTRHVLQYDVREGPAVVNFRR